MPDRDIRELDRRAVDRSVDIVSLIRPEDLARPTPCEGWTVSDLLAHMTVQHHGFAASAEGQGADPGVWQVTPNTGGVLATHEPGRDYRRAAERVTAAFAAADVVRDRFALAEFGAGAVFPAMQAISFHFIDYLVHAWDVARSIDEEYRPDEDLLAPALTITLAVPTGDARTKPGAAFRPELSADPGADPWAQILGLLGRSLDWAPSTR